jgi:hypothetical protein
MPCKESGSGSENRSFLSDETRRILRSNLAGVILCSRGESPKLGAISTTMSEGDFAEIPFNSAAAAKVEESLYNKELSRMPHVVAGFKAYQTSLGFPEMLENLFPGMNLSDRKVAIVATDMMAYLRSRRLGRGWEAMQKPSENSTKDDLKMNFLRYLTGNEYCCGDRVEVMFRCGAASLVMGPNNLKRGLTGVLELYFWFEKFSEAEIDNYLESMQLEKLLSVNFGLYWQNPVLKDKIMQISNCDRNNQLFNTKMDYFDRYTSSGLPEIDTLLYSALTNSEKNSQGNLTHEVRRLADKFLGKSTDVGQWSNWYPPGQISQVLPRR